MYALVHKQPLDLATAEGHAMSPRRRHTVNESISRLSAQRRNEELLVTRAAIESTSRHFRRVFDDMPLPYVVTDV